MFLVTNENMGLCLCIPPQSSKANNANTQCVGSNYSPIFDWKWLAKRIIRLRLLKPLPPPCPNQLLLLPCNHSILGALHCFPISSLEWFQWCCNLKTDAQQFHRYIVVNWTWLKLSSTTTSEASQAKTAVNVAS